MYHVSAQGVNEHMINVHYYYIFREPSTLEPVSHTRDDEQGDVSDFIPQDHAVNCFSHT